MLAKAPESPVARKTDDPGGKKKEAISLTLPPELHARVMALKAATGQSASMIAGAALAQRIGAFEKDPGEMLKPSDDSSSPSSPTPADEK